MKLQGKKIPTAEVIVPIIRDSGNLYFTASPVLNYDDFLKLCPEPKPPKRMLPGGVMQENVADPNYKKKLEMFATHRTHYMILKSLQSTPGLDWDTVKLDDPETWANYESEMRGNGIAEGEIARVINGVIQANGLDDSKVEEARRGFLASAQAAVDTDQSIQKAELLPTESGEPANVSE